MNNSEILAAYYRQHFEELVGFIGLRIKSYETARDMVQDLFLRLLQDQTILIDPARLNSRVYVMARNLIIDYYRRQQRRQQFEHYLSRQDLSEDAESVISASFLMEQLEQSLARLSQPCATMMRFHIYYNMKVGQIAQKMMLPYHQVEYQLGKARKDLRQKICI